VVAKTAEIKHDGYRLIVRRDWTLFPLELRRSFTCPSLVFDCSSCCVNGCQKLDKIFRSRSAGVFSRQRLAQVTDSALKIAHILIRHRGILHFWATQPSPKGVATLVPPLKVEREATYTAEVGGAGPALPGPGHRGTG
jgi:hypothetical protein